ncbi:MAG: carboxypeptidase-like regulatory domain-containing protein [Bacteroidota bacterium]
MIRWIGIFLLVSTSALGQVIEGKIVDAETGKPVPFASVGVVGTARGTSSNIDGEFSLFVSGDASIKITCIGYASTVVNSLGELAVIQLKPIATQLTEIVIYDKEINPRKIVRKAFASVADNFDTKPFSQTFFYRHYCKDDDEYGRLIEASVDVWKHKGYGSVQSSAGEKEEIRVTQLRRSLDKTAAAQGHTPIAIKSILHADMAAYQSAVKTEHLSFFHDVNNLKTDFDQYFFRFGGVTYYDGQEVYVINFRYKEDSLLTTSGYIPAARSEGSLYITTDTHAFVKTEETKYQHLDTVRTSAYYRKYNDKYFPYHLTRVGKSQATDRSTHWFHIELMSVEIKPGDVNKFTGNEPSKEELLKIPYDSVFWVNNTTLKTTPLEDDIINDLGGGHSLNEQFQLYKEYERNLADGGIDGEQKFNWLRDFSRGNRILYVGFWGSDCRPYLAELEHVKRLNQQYKGEITFVLLSLENDELKWRQAMEKYNLFADGIIHYRIGDHSDLARRYKLKEIPSYILLSRNGDAVSDFAKHPTDAQLQADFGQLLSQE